MPKWSPYKKDNFKKYKTLFPLKQCLFFRSGKLYFFSVFSREFMVHYASVFVTMCRKLIEERTYDYERSY